VCIFGFLVFILVVVGFCQYHSQVIGWKDSSRKWPIRLWVEVQPRLHQGNMLLVIGNNRNMLLVHDLIQLRCVSSWQLYTGSESIVGRMQTETWPCGLSVITESDSSSEQIAGRQYYRREVDGRVRRLLQQYTVHTRRRMCGNLQGQPRHRIATLRFTAQASPHSVLYDSSKQKKSNIKTESESECKCLTCDQKPTGSQFSLLHEPNWKVNGGKTKKKTIEQSGVRRGSPLK